MVREVVANCFTNLSINSLNLEFDYCSRYFLSHIKIIPICSFPLYEGFFALLIHAIDNGGK